MFIVMKQVFIRLGFFVASSTQTGKHFFSPFRYFLQFLIHGATKKDGLMKERDKDSIFTRKNKGLLIDGIDKRLSLKESFNHLAVISPTGGGKTTSYVIPNIFKLADEKNSMVITDISGELHEKTSGYLAKKGYKIYILNPEDLSESIRYNPLFYIQNSVDIDELTSILMKSNHESSTSSSDKEYWEQSAKSLIAMTIKLLLLRRNPKHINLANVRYIINNFGVNGAPIKHLFEECGDIKLLSEFLALTQINPNTLTSIVANANTALNPIGINDNLEELTANHTINFDRFRKEKSVLYIKIPGQKQKQYKFLLNTFYQQFFNHMMVTLPNENDLPIFCLLDEFGNMNLPNFDTTITTIRKYKISVSIIVQDTNQLAKAYGAINAETILNGGITSKLYYTGMSLDTAKELSETIGDVEQIEIDSKGNMRIKEKRAMRANEIRTMADNEALFITANKIPAKLIIKPYYKDFIYNQYSKLPKFKIDTQEHLEDIDFVEIFE
jgi:type IV secretory pathway TraG/TraD family ATPase VirD4